MFDQYNGFFNKSLTALGFGAIRGSPTAAGDDLAHPGRSWQRVGFDMLIYLAGLQGVGPELSRPRDRRRHVVAAVPPDHLPTARPVDVLPAGHEHHLLVPGLRHVWAMTRAAPTTPRRVVTYAYRGRSTSTGRELGYGAAIGIVIHLITLVITIVQWRSNNNRDLTE